MKSTLLLGVSLVILKGIGVSASVIVFRQVKRANIKKSKKLARVVKRTGENEMGAHAMHNNVKVEAVLGTVAPTTEMMHKTKNQPGLTMAGAEVGMWIPNY